MHWREKARKRGLNHKIKQHRKAKRRQLAQQRAAAAEADAERPYRTLDGHTYGLRFTPAEAHSQMADEARRQERTVIIDETGPLTDAMARVLTGRT